MQVNSAQDYLTQVKRQILAKAPALALALSPQNRRSNDTYTAQLANRASRYEKVPYPQTLSLAPGSVPGFAYVTAGLRPTVSLCCVAAAVAAGFVDVWANALAVVTTLAGGGSFSNRWQPAFLPNGNIVIAGNNTHKIHLITMPGGTETILAGGDTATFADGTGGVGGTARFWNPAGVAVLPNGNVVVADTGNQRIRLITMPGGAVTTLAGQATGGFADGTGAAAQFSNPAGIAVLPNGNIVVAEQTGHTIRLITMPDAVVTTLAGSGGSASFANGTGSTARFNWPTGIAVLPNGNIVVCERVGSRVRLVTPAGVVTTLAGDGTNAFLDGIGAGAKLGNPQGISVLPNGNVVLADTDNNRVRLITPAGVVTTLAGQATAGSGNGIGVAAQFNGPTGIAGNPSSGVIVVNDFNNSFLRLITPT